MLTIIEVSSYRDRTSFELQWRWLCRCSVRKVQGSRHYVIVSRINHKALDTTRFWIDSNALLTVVRIGRIDNREGIVRREGWARNKLAVFGSNGNNNTINRINEWSIRILGSYGKWFLIRRVRIWFGDNIEARWDCFGDWNCGKCCDLFRCVDWWLEWIFAWKSAHRSGCPASWKTSMLKTPLI